jgi:WD40 repeat protein
VLLREDGGATRAIAADAVVGGVCAVSEDGRQVAYHESSSFGLRWLSLPDGKELGRHKVDRFRRLHFTKHGLVVLLPGRVEVMSGPEKGFAIDLPEARFGSSQPMNFDNDKGDSAFSPDGDLVAMSSGRGASHAVVVDLRSRSLRAILHHPPGRPRLAFSLDGLRVFAANLKNGSTLSGWRLPVEDLPKKPRWWTWGVLTSNGRAAALWDAVSGRVELFRPVDKLVLSGVRSTGFSYKLLGDGALDAFVSVDLNEAILRDLEKDQVVWRRPCRLCKDISVSQDGVHFALIGADGLEVWNTRTGQRLFLETRRVRPEAPVTTIANDGRRLAWGFVDQVILRDLDAAREQALPSDGALHDLKFSPDGSRLAATGTANTTLWDAVTGRVLWSVPRDVPDAAVLRWSLDGRALLLDHAYTVHELLDVASGERLAWFETLGPPITPVMAAMYAPDLRVKAVASFTSWERRPVPQPDESVPEQSLARTMRRTGLAFRGVDLVAAP